MWNDERVKINPIIYIEGVPSPYNIIFNRIREKYLKITSPTYLICISPTTHQFAHIRRLQSQVVLSRFDLRKAFLKRGAEKKDYARFDVYLDNGHSKLGDFTSIYGLLFFFVCMHDAFGKSDLCWHNDLYRPKKAGSFFLTNSI